MIDISNIKMIVGLGNMGDEYKKTRHNAGFMFLDFLHQGNWKEDKQKQYLEAEWNSIRLIKPTTMMNLSGRAVRAAIDFYKITPDQIMVAHDDLDIPLGSYKFQLTTGPKVHNGLTSINQFLGTADYWRLRIGVENREVKGNKGIPGLDYSLDNFKVQEVQTLQECFAEILQNLT